MTHFFKYAKTILKATQEDVVEDTAEASEVWRNRAKVEGVHYDPFTNDHIKRIFDPSPFLAKSRDPDYFWGPLLGLHLGARLGEFVTAKLKDIGYNLELQLEAAQSDCLEARVKLRQESVGLGRRSEIWPQRGQFLPGLQVHSRSYGPRSR